MHFLQRHRYAVALVLFVACMGIGVLTWILVAQALNPGGPRTITAGATVTAGPVETVTPRGPVRRAHEIGGV